MRTEFNLGKEREPYVRNKHAISCTGKITRAELAHVPTPRATASHIPIPHAAVVEALFETLSHRQIFVVDEEFALSKDGMEMFGVLDLETSFEGCRLAIGIRNANDKRFRLVCTVGLRVFVCRNLAFRGDYAPEIAKRSQSCFCPTARCVSSGPTLSFAKISAVHGMKYLGRSRHWPSTKILAMIPLLRHFVGWLVGAFQSREDLMLENLALRQQLLALRAKRPRRRLGSVDKVFWVALRKLWSGWKKPLLLVTPETVVRWHRIGFQLYWSWLSRTRRAAGRKPLSREVRDLIFRMVAENARWEHLASTGSCSS